LRDNGLDDDVFVALTHTSGARSQLWGSWSQSAPGPRFRVTGTEATYVLQPSDSQEDALLAGETPATLGDQWGVEAPETHGTLYRGLTSAPYPTERGRWDTFYPAFARAVRGLNPPPVDVNDAVATATVLDAARLSATTGMVVPVPPE
jgi:predicted dehydrogenase